MNASFRLSDEQIQEIRKALETEEKIDRTFAVEVKDELGTVVAEVQKLIHVKRKAAAIARTKDATTESIAAG